jgi:hypothetical protein
MLKKYQIFDLYILTRKENAIASILQANLVIVHFLFIARPTIRQSYSRCLFHKILCAFIEEQKGSLGCQPHFFYFKDTFGG